MKRNYLISIVLLMVAAILPASLLAKTYPISAAVEIENSPIEVREVGPLRIHTFYGVSNSHIIETPNKLWLVDAQMTFSDARSVKSYLETLNKPLQAVLISHNHPDHWFGAEVFKGMAPIVSTQEVVDDLNKGGMRFIKILKDRLGDDMPSEVIEVEPSLETGDTEWDGVAVNIEVLKDHESLSSVVIRLPEYRVLIGQDLFYNNMFLVASERTRNKNWGNILQQLIDNDSKNYELILVGHGKNGGFEIAEENISYLNTLEEVLTLGLTKEETKQMMLDKYPNRGGEEMLDISMRNLFKAH